MSEARIFLSPPHMSEQGYELSYIHDAFASNWIAPLGSYVDRFEQELSFLTDRQGAVALNSGTSAIHMALRSCGVNAGDLVLCSSFTFAASCNPIIYQQGTPVFIDSDPLTWNMDPDLLEKALEDARQKGQRVGAVIAVSLYGQPAALLRISEICAHYKVPLIDEAAEALGAHVGGKPCGSFGHFGILSFNGNKIITTSGGGAIVSNDLEALAKIRFWATQSRDPAPHYEHSELGFNYRLSNISAAIGCGQLRVFPERLSARRNTFERYAAFFEDISDIAMMPTYGTPNRWLSVITFAPTCPQTPASVAKVLADASIETRPTWKPMNLQPYWKKYAFYAKNAQQPVGDDLFARGLCLPSGSSLLPTDQDRIIELVRSCFSEN